jgi:hypothetical protein
MDAKRLEEMMLLNMVTLSKLCRLFIPEMKRSGKGGVINVASTAAYQPIPYFSTYAASKAYVLSLTEALHIELKGSGVEVMALCPGPTETGFFEAAGRGSFGMTQTPEAVVDEALRGYLAQKMNVVSGFTNRFTSTLSGLTPRRWSAELAARLVKKSVK